MNRGDRYRAVRIAALFVGLGMLVVAIGPEIAGVGAPGLGGMQLGMLVSAMVAFLVAVAIGRVPGKYILGLSISLLALGGCFGFLALSQGDVGWMLWRLKTQVLGGKPLEIHEADEILGWVNRPGATATDLHYDYQVTYRIDRAGYRQQGADEKGAEEKGADAKGILSTEGKRVVVLGCSFTFGQGVEDHQTYVSRLEAASGGKIAGLNAGVNGWGTVQAMLFLQRMLERGEKPDLIAYGFLPIHAGRNGDRESWLRIVALSERKKPIVKEVEGSWAFDRLVGAGEGSQGSRRLDDEEIAITLGCIEQMHRLSTAAEIPFYCLLLGEDRLEETPAEIRPKSVREFCVSKGIPVLDFSALPHERYPHDGHPTASWHQRVAEAIAEELVFDEGNRVTTYRLMEKDSAVQSQD